MAKMQTKKPRKSLQTARRPRQTTNGRATPQTPTPLTISKTPSHSAMKSPTAQPAELSEVDRERLRDYLLVTDRPFSVATLPASRKRKRGAQQMYIQDDIFEDRLSVQYEVRPKDKWESLRRYKKFSGKRTIHFKMNLCQSGHVTDGNCSWIGKHCDGRMYSCKARRKRRSET